MLNEGIFSSYKTNYLLNIGTVLTRAYKGSVANHRRQCGICAEQSGTSTRFSLSTSINSVSVIPPMLNTLSIASHGRHIHFWQFTPSLHFVSGLHDGSIDIS